MWTCPKCKENIEDNFDTCWKCTGEAQKAAAPPKRKKPLERLEFIFLMLFIIPPVIAFLHRKDGGDRLRAVIFDLSVMAVGAVGLVAVWIYRRTEKARDGKEAD
jgi:hypothetical protein